ncbi:hypothetical protein [Limoniibacter endophyticus]|uniref:Uncharacterized protein n=1 Tax=Limoniibacter endophyticus TaxID=1565040 RepID=A0A8J3GHJ3_9HYPH|nr:hypothetical protein [Limoniibacter endophyticus]GHC79517.1 hypothetical protein GCM10010136_32130 [Limoniibacter endophyticus]
MIILGLDAAQATGWAYYDTQASLSAIRAGTIKATGDDYEHKAATLGRGLVKLIKEKRPDFVVIEMPIRTQPTKQKRSMKFMGEETVEEAAGSGLNAVISSNQMVGAVSAIIGAYNLPFATIPSVSWRKQFLGFGTRRGWQRTDWKKAVRDRCSQLKIIVTNDDMADAVGVAFAGSQLQAAKMLEVERRAA